jgi:hypothetical protein
VVVFSVAVTEEVTSPPEEVTSPSFTEQPVNTAETAAKLRITAIIFFITKILSQLIANPIDKNSISRKFCYIRKRGVDKFGFNA